MGVFLKSCKSLRNQHGVTLVEYVCLVALVSITVIIALTNIGISSNSTFARASESIGGGTSGTVEQGRDTPNNDE